MGPHFLPQVAQPVKPLSVVGGNIVYTGVLPWSLGWGLLQKAVFYTVQNRRELLSRSEQAV